MTGGLKRSFPGNDPHLPRDTWVRLPSQVSTAASLAVVVSVPLDAEHSCPCRRPSAGGHPQGQHGEYGDAVTEARKAVDAVDGKVPDRQAERQIAAIRKQ